MSPKVSMWINIGLSVFGFLASASALLTPLFGQGTAQTIVGASGLAVGLIGAVNTGLHATSTSEPGPLTK